MLPECRIVAETLPIINHLEIRGRYADCRFQTVFNDEDFPSFLLPHDDGRDRRAAGDSRRDCRNVSALRSAGRRGAVGSDQMIVAWQTNETTLDPAAYSVLLADDQEAAIAYRESHFSLCCPLPPRASYS